MTNCACHTEMQGWSFESFWREEKSACGKPDCGRTAVGAQAREERSTLAQPATAGLAPAVRAMAMGTTADRAGVGLTLVTLSFGALSVLAAMLHYAL